ncbi:type II toxin-antitoxin system PemK/MazF family toxin [Okeania sp. SIO3I5]|uniref:type II toxin-antitoxin system PemK/MazF family toxin n=1 Tax=Okeania sp. SIO3I5 TaxID=2607805 RepID=UPI00341A5D2A
MADSSNYGLGSIWIARFDPSIRTEIRKTRPALVISGTAFNIPCNNCYAFYLS